MIRVGLPIGPGTNCCHVARLQPSRVQSSLSARGNGFSSVNRDLSNWYSAPLPEKPIRKVGGEFRRRESCLRSTLNATDWRKDSRAARSWSRQPGSGSFSHAARKINVIFSSDSNLTRHGYRELDSGERDRSSVRAEGAGKSMAGVFWRRDAAPRQLDSVRSRCVPHHAEKQKNEEGTRDRAPGSGMKQQSNRGRHFVSAYRSSSWYMIPLATKLFGSQLCVLNGRHDLNLMVLAI